MVIPLKIGRYITAKQGSPGRVVHIFKYLGTRRIRALQSQGQGFAHQTLIDKRACQAPAGKGPSGATSPVKSLRHGG